MLFKNSLIVTQKTMKLIFKQPVMVIGIEPAENG